MRFLGRTAVVSADPEFNRFVLQNELKLFQNNPPPHFKTPIGEGNLASLKGETYKRKKSLVHGFFKAFQLPTTYLPKVEDAAQRVMTAWRHKNRILATEEINKFIFSLALGKAMGMTPDDPQFEELRRAFAEVNRRLSAIPLNLPFTRYSKALKARDIIWSVVKRKTEDRKLNIDRADDEENDLIGYFLKDNPSMPTQNILEEVLGFVLGASLSTDITLALAMSSWDSIQIHSNK